MSQESGSVKLTKGGNVSLTGLAQAAQMVLRSVGVACGWDANQGSGKAYDLDLSAVGLDNTGKAPDTPDPKDKNYQAWFVYANHRKDRPCKALRFKGDNRTGHGKGDDETITVDLDAVPDYIVSIKFQVVIWQALERGNQRFGNVKNAFIRIYNLDTGQEIARFDITEEFSDETLVIFGELYRHNGEWKFRAIGQGTDPAKYRQEHNIHHPFETEAARYLF